MTKVYVIINREELLFFHTLKDARLWLKDQSVLRGLYQRYQDDMNYIARTGKRGNCLFNDVFVDIYDIKDYDNPDRYYDQYPIERYNLFDMLVRNKIIKKH